MANTPEEDAFLKADEVLPTTPNDHQQAVTQPEELCYSCNAMGVDLLPILRVMKRREVRTMSYHPEKEYSRFFDVVFSTLSKIREEQSLSLQTQLVALSYYCRFVERVPIDCRRVSSYALVCLIIAVQYEDSRDSACSPEKMLALYPECDVRESDLQPMMEDVLMALNWRLECITPVHFTSIYCSEPMLSRLVSSSYLQKMEDGKPNRHFFVSFCDFFCSFLSSQYKYRQYRPSLLAAVCFTITRKALRVKPMWEERYSEWLQADGKEVADVVEMLWRDYMLAYPDHYGEMNTPSNALFV